MALALLVVSPAHADLGSDGHIPSGMEAIAVLNAERGSHGLPADIVERPEWTAACAQHVAYMDATDQPATHDSDPSHPLYTPEGKWAADSSAIGSWFEPPNRVTGTIGDYFPAFVRSPVHRMQLLGPGLAETGASGRCIITWPGYTRPQPAEPVLYTVPGDGFTNQAVSEPQVTKQWRAPVIYVLAFGTGRGRLTEAALTGPSGPVDVVRSDNATPFVGDALPPGGYFIPSSHLRPFTTYAASATFESFDGVVLSRTWTFRTRGLDADLYVADDLGRRLSVSSESPATITLTVARRPGEPALLTRRFRRRGGLSAPKGRRLYACAEQAESPPYRAERYCDFVTPN